MNNPTIKDVAKKANVSIATVSLVIHDHKRISKETKLKVLDAIEELNYYPSRSARGLVSKKTGNVGFILTNDHFLRTEPFYTNIFIGTEFGARENELYVLLNTVDSNYKENDPLPRFILERNIDGIIIAGKVPNVLIEKLCSFKLPVVFIDFQYFKDNCPTVVVDNALGGRMAVNHLIELGHKNIAFVGGDIQHPSISDRFKGFYSAMEGANIDVNKDFIDTEEDYPAASNGFNAAKRLFEKNKNITAVFACNDAMAMGVIQYLKEKGKRIPEDISIIGFDDVIPTNSTGFSLSTIRIPKMEMGVEAMRLMSALLRGDTKINKKITVPVELIVRSSTQRM